VIDLPDTESEEEEEEEEEEPRQIIIAPRY